MTISAWRIVNKEYVATAVAGEGARIAGGRWNSPKIPVVYAAGSISLAILEVLVHLLDVPELPELRLIEIQFADALVTAIDPNTLPREWRRNRSPKKLQQIGDQWVQQQRSVVLRVPSVITGEPNYLLNPQHADFAKLHIGKPAPITLDARLLPESLRPKRKS